MPTLYDPLVHDANAMRLAVGNIENACRINKHTMRTRQPALQRIWLWTVPSLAGAEHRCDDAALDRDAANDVVLGIGHKQISPAISQSLGARQFGEAGRPAVTRIALLTSAGQMMNRASFRCDAVDGIAFAQGEVKVAFLVESDGSRAIQRRTFHWHAVGRRLLLARAAVGFNDAAR